jgi:uridine phosphorylase
MNKPDTDQFLPLIKVHPRHLTPYALLVGDPNRVRDTAPLMSDVREIGNNREYLTMTGTYAGQRLTVASHGIGAGGANVCFMELLKGGVRVLIRAGTCGAMHTEIDDGDLIIATGAVREDAATEHLMPLAYPAVADRQVVNALVQAARRHGYDDPHVGLLVSQANFYPSAMRPAPWEKYVGYGVLGVEMEMSALLVVAHMVGARAGGIATTDGNLVRKADPEMDGYDPHREVVARGKQAMLQIALEALADLANEDSSPRIPCPSDVKDP